LLEGQVFVEAEDGVVPIHYLARQRDLP
jgi:hypothetical protein